MGWAKDVMGAGSARVMSGVVTAIIPTGSGLVDSPPIGNKPTSSYGQCRVWRGAKSRTVVPIGRVVH